MNKPFKNIFVFCAMLLFAGRATAQVCEGLPIFTENFENGLPSTWKTFNLDGGILLPSMINRGFTNAWAPQRFLGKRCVSTSSRFTNGETANDYLISPNITIPAGAGNICLSFQVAGLRNFYAEALDVMVSTTGATIAGLQAHPVLSANTYSNVFFKTYTIDLSSYAGKTINLGFWYHSTPMFAIVLDDIRIAKMQSKDIALSNFQMDKVLSAGTHSIKGSVLNGGTTALTSYSLHWKVGNGSVQTQNYTNVNIPPGDAVPFTHQTTWNATANGVYKLKVWARTSNDINYTNDTISRTIYINNKPRKVLVEEFTQASCPPCAIDNPPFDSLLHRNEALGKLSALKYHTVWPGNDPMYDLNPDEIDDRTVYYQILGVPSAVVDGTFNLNGIGFPGILQSITQAYLDSLFARPTIFEIGVNTATTVNYSTINVRITVKAFAPIAANMFTLRGALYEKKVDYQGVAPGTNGETLFYDVMRKMIPNADGIALPAMQAGQTLTYDFVVPNRAQDYVSSNLRVTAFVQDDEDQKIYQSNTSSLLVGNDTAKLAEVMTISPNPANERFFVSFSDGWSANFSANLTDMLGRVVINNISLQQSNNEIETIQLPNGVYLLNIYDENGLWATKKVSVHH